MRDVAPAVEHAREKCKLSERHACRLVEQGCGTQRYLPIQRVDGRCAAPNDHYPRQRVWPLRLPENHGAVADGRVAGGQGSGAEHLAARRGLGNYADGCSFSCYLCDRNAGSVIFAMYW